MKGNIKGAVLHYYVESKIYIRIMFFLSLSLFVVNILPVIVSLGYDNTQLGHSSSMFDYCIIFGIITLLMESIMWTSNNSIRGVFANPITKMEAAIGRLIVLVYNSFIVLFLTCIFMGFEVLVYTIFHRFFDGVIFINNYSMITLTSDLVLGFLLLIGIPSVIYLMAMMIKKNIVVGVILSAVLGYYMISMFWLEVQGNSQGVTYYIIMTTLTFIVVSLCSHLITYFIQKVMEVD